MTERPGVPAPAPPLSPEPAWAARFRAARLGLPQWAELAPDRCVLTSDEGGRLEVWAWDRATGARRRVTDRPDGTGYGAISPDGSAIWWFADTGGDEFGVWMRQPFEGGEDAPALPGVPAAYPAGLAFARDGSVVVGCSDDAGSTVYQVPVGGPPVVLYRSAQDASVGDVSRDGRLVVIEHSEHGDSRHPALRCLTRDGTVIADLADGPGRGLSVCGFADDDDRVLVAHERHGRSELLVWDPAAGSVHELRLDIEGDLDGEWFPDGRRLLVTAEARARSTAWRYDLTTGQLERLDLPSGVIRRATARPDGDVWLSCSSAAVPGRLVDAVGTVLLEPAGPRPLPSLPVRDLEVAGPGGRIHALVGLPGGQPRAVVFLVHGGPTAHDADAFSADRAALLDCGYGVVQVNYRGSTGYGSAWRDALEGDVGHTELADLAAVRHALVEKGTATPGRIVLAGASWGGYLTLLGIGAQPELWDLGVAEVPVADYVTAYEDEMEALKAFDRSLFGGSPQDVPEAYQRASPLTYVDQVRAPVLLTVGENDPRCPSRQVDRYLERLVERGHPHEVYRFDAGHGSLVVDERIRQCALLLDFLDRRAA